jgi:hypothetical protein
MGYRAGGGVMFYRFIKLRKRSVSVLWRDINFTRQSLLRPYNPVANNDLKYDLYLGAQDESKPNPEGLIKHPSGYYGFDFGFDSSGMKY